MERAVESRESGTPEYRFRYRLDIYWKALAIYAVTFILYATIRGTIEDDGFSIRYDPILLTLFLFIILGVIAVSVHSVLDRQIVITDKEIRLQNRLRTLHIPRSEIRAIRFRSSRPASQGPRYRIVLLYLKSRRRPIRIRPSLYENERKLIEHLQAYKQQLPIAS